MILLPKNKAFKMGSNSERARKALDAMKLLGFPKKQATPVLKRLLMLFDNNWEPNEGECYRALADAILDAQDNKPTPAASHHGTDEEPEPRAVQQGSGQTINTSASASRYGMAADDDNETPLIKRPRIKGKSLEPEPPQPTVSTQAAGPASRQPTHRQTRALTAAQQATDHGDPSAVVTYERDNGSLLENPQDALLLKEPNPEPAAIDASTCPDVPVGPVAKQMNICSSGIRVRIDLVRIKVGVKDPCKIPFKSEVITPKMLLYDVYFKVESVVQIGWSRQISQKNADLTVEDKALGDENENLVVRDAKRQKSLSTEFLISKDLGKEVRGEKDSISIQGDTNFVVGTSARKGPIQQNVKLHSELKMRPQEDVVLVQKETAGARMTDHQEDVVLVQKETAGAKMNAQEDDTMLGSQEKVQFSGSEGREELGTQESDPDYFAKQVGVVVADSQEIDSFEEKSGQNQCSFQGINPRRSSRLKDSDEVNVIDKAKERAKAKDLEKGKGNGLQNQCLWL